MKPLIFLVVFIFRFSVHAESLPANLKYEFQKKIPAKKIIEVLNQVFYSGDLVALRTGVVTAPTADGLDQIYANTELGSAVFVKLGLKVNEENFLDRMYDHPEGKVYHLKAYGKFPVALFFYQMPESAAKEIVTKMIAQFAQKKSSARFPFLLQKFLVPVANAGESCPLNDTAAPPFAQIAGKIIKSSATTKLGSCLMDAWKGAQKSAINRVAGFADFISDFVKDPLIAWDHVAQSFKNLAKFAMNFRVQLTDFFEIMGDLKDEMTADFFCAMVGSLGPDALLLIAGGVASVKVGMMVSEYIQRLQSVRGFIKLTAQMKVLGKIQKLPRDFLARLMRGEIPTGMINSIERFSGNRLLSLASGAAQCAP